MNEDVKNKLKLFRDFRNDECLLLNRLSNRTWNDVNGDVNVDGRQQKQAQGTCALLEHDVQVEILSNIRITLRQAKSNKFMSTSHDIDIIATKS